MYCSHFGLHRPPFNNTPDPTFYFSTPEHEEALATLQYIVFQRKGFVLVTGEVGAGKTLIGRMFLRQVDRSASVAVISHTNLTGRQLLAAICHEFELDTPPDATNLQLTERLQNYLLEQFAQDRFAVVLLDEAQNLPDESFEELRMLGNLEADDAKLLQICILGQPELRERFHDPRLRQIDQRLFRRFHLPALSRANTEAYIRHRLRVAGCDRSDLFTKVKNALLGEQNAAESVTRLCLALNGVMRHSQLDADSVVSSIQSTIEREARWTNEEIDRWTSIEPIFVRLLGSSAFRVVAKAMDLSYEYANLYRRARILTDIRPLFMSDAESVEAAVISYTLRLRFDSADGEHELSIAMDEGDVRELRDQCERALKKARVARDLMANTAAIPTIVTGERSDA